MAYDDDQDDFAERDELTFLELAKTRLRVYEDELQRLNANSSPSLRIPLADIHSIDLHKAFDPVCLIFIGAALALVAIAHTVSEWEFLTVSLDIVAAILGLIACFGFVTRSFIVGTVDGTIKIQCEDAPDEAEGFVVSLRQMLRTLKDQEPPRRPNPSGPETGFRS